MNMTLFQVDAFTDQPFAGNPAAVCLLSEAQDERWMRLVAREMNLSETAFVHRQEDGFSLRWFTPLIEVDLCGHATLATAHVLWESGWLQADEVASFYTRSGLLTAERRNNVIELNFPALSLQATPLPAHFARALGVTPTYSGKFGAKHLLEVENEEILRSLTPDFAALKAHPGRGIVVTSLASSAEYDIVSRYFAPWVGVDEDPATGSSHCALGPYWAQKLGKNKLNAYQASVRGGAMRVRVEGERVYLGGQAVTVLAGKLLA